jgi:putative NIF3 family GTP cyclohydrolase 1 type 2
METVMEQRLELLIRRDQLAKAVKTMLSVHPYEEPAFDCYPLLNESSSVGLGRIGRLAEQTNLGELATTIGQQLGCTDIRLVGDPARKISTVAVCSGSGASLLHDAVRAGADLLLTGDVKYHEAREAELQGIAVLDAGHFPTEQLMVDAIRAYLETSLATSGCQLEIVSSRREQNPFTNVVIR